MSQYDPKNPYAGPFETEEPQGRYPAMAPPQTSGAAVASLVLGLLFCVPLLPSMLAVVFGFIGIRRTRNPYVGGRGMAISGLILGLMGTGIWLVAGSGLVVFAQWIGTEQTRAEAVVDEFLKDLSEGKIDAALALSAPGTRRADLASAADAIKGAGPYNEIAARPQPIAAENLQFRWFFEGQAIFSRDKKTFRLTLEPDGRNYKVDRFSWK